MVNRVGSWTRNHCRSDPHFTITCVTIAGVLTECEGKTVDIFHNSLEEQVLIAGKQVYEWFAACNILITINQMIVNVFVEQLCLRACHIMFVYPAIHYLYTYHDISFIQYFHIL